LPFIAPSDDEGYQRDDHRAWGYEHQQQEQEQDWPFGAGTKGEVH
jgi:hypothetical protein